VIRLRAYVIVVLTACAPVPQGGGAGGTGGAASCAVASDCGVDTACVAWSCEENACVAANTAEGPLPPAAQAPGDCERLNCDGQGNLVSLPDDMDAPAPTSCATPSCAQGEVVVDFAPIGTPCGNAGQCDDQGNCSSCLGPSDCAPGGPCVKVECAAGQCQSSNQPIGYADASFQQTTGDCHKNACDGLGNLVNIIDDMDVPSDGKPCTMDVCNNGVPSHVEGDGPCGTCTTAFDEEGYCLGGTCFACP